MQEKIGRPQKMLLLCGRVADKHCWHITVSQPCQSYSMLLTTEKNDSVSFVKWLTLKAGCLNITWGLEHGCIAGVACNCIKPGHIIVGSCDPQQRFYSVFLPKQKGQAFSLSISFIPEASYYLLDGLVNCVCAHHFVQGTAMIAFFVILVHRTASNLVLLLAH
jgi:hypothetical protein